MFISRSSKNSRPKGTTPLGYWKSCKLYTHISQMKCGTFRHLGSFKLLLLSGEPSRWDIITLESLSVQSSSFLSSRCRGTKIKMQRFVWNKKKNTKKNEKKNWKNTKQFCQTIKDIRFLFLFFCLPNARSWIKRNVTISRCAPRYLTRTFANTFKYLPVFYPPCRVLLHLARVYARDELFRW